MSQRNPTFPCNLCGAPLEVRETKKDKPYLICNSCGVQVFIRYAAGIQRFKNLLAQANGGDVKKLLAILTARYMRTCADCGHQFWIEEKQIKTSGWDGKFKGYGCPKCGALVKAEVPKK